MPESSSTFDLSFYSLSRLLLDPDPNGIKDQFVTCAVYELRPNCGRPVTGFPGQLRLHPALDELGWIGVTDEFNEATGLTNQSLPEPILITTNGTILAGIGCWRAAVFDGQQELNCIEYSLSHEEALKFILTHHGIRRGWNPYVRICLALTLEFSFQEKARDNMRAGGQRVGRFAQSWAH